MLRIAMFECTDTYGRPTMIAAEHITALIGDPTDGTTIVMLTGQSRDEGLRVRESLVSIRERLEALAALVGPR